MEEDLELDELFTLWNDDRASDAGRIVFQRVPFKDRVYWASQMLEWTTAKLRVECEYILAVLTATRDRGKWGLGHDLSSEGGKIISQLAKKNGHAQPLRESLVWLGILTARIMYNASNPDDPYDDDTGWYIGSTLKTLADAAGNGEFAKGAWDQLTILMLR